MTQTLIPAIAPDGSLYPIDKLAAHQNATLHQAVSVFVFSGDALLIQRRADTKYHCGGAWANTCCTHPHWGESLDDSAHRRLQQELGCDVNLTRAGKLTYKAEVTNDLWEHEQVQVYQAHIDKERLVLSPDPAEVSQIAWATIDDIRADMANRPDRYAPWFLIYLQRWPELAITPE